MADMTQGWALGLMSGTSMDGIDAALIRSDGIRIEETGPSLTVPYDDTFRGALKGVLGGQGDVAAVERSLTERHLKAVRALLSEAGLAPADVRVVGFHGHTILHEPDQGRTWQIGDGALLAKSCGIDVVYDFRANDVAAGGEGAPFAPIYHAARACDLEKPLAVLNLGGVGNVTWIGYGGGQLLAFDTGPGNALLDDWMARHGGEACDRDGAAARQGQVKDSCLARLLDNAYFEKPAPKSLDRDHFSLDPVEELSLTDGAATLTAFTAASVAEAMALFPVEPVRWLVTGGGRHNPVMMEALHQKLAVPVDPVEAVGWDGDALEAQAFAFLALRSLNGLPLSLPATTGVPQPLGGGKLAQAA